MAIETVADTDIYWEAHGAGDPVLMISGYSANHAFWMPQLGALAAQHKVILFDNPGIGATRDKGLPLTIRDMAHRIADFMHDIGVPRAHVVGHSMGGALAICLAALHPSQVNRLVLMNSAPKLRPVTRHVLTNLLNLRLSDIKLFTLLNAMIPWYFSDDSIRDGKRPAEMIDFFIKHHDAQSITDQSRQLDALLAFDAKEWLPTIRANTLVLSGEFDLLTPPSDGDSVAEAIPQAVHHRLSAAHNMPQEIPHTINPLLLDFLAP